MVRQTSIDCYNQIKSEGLLSLRRLEAYKALLKISPCTATELQKSMDYNSGGRDCMKRLSELRDTGVIYEVRTRKCNVTGKIVIEWDSTDKLPQGKVVNTNAKPNNLKKCISYIINKMNEDGVLFVDVDYLKNIEN